MSTRFRRLLATWAVSMSLAADPLPVETSLQPLLVGNQVPGDTELTTAAGVQTTLGRELAGQPAVLLFFRGGWCPYCDLQLSELRLIEDDLKSLGYKVIAISPDPPVLLRARGDRMELSYELLSDREYRLIRAFGIALPTSRRDTPEKASAAGPAWLTVPAVYLVDDSGKTTFQYVNPDYRVRVPKELLLAAAKAFAVPPNQGPHR